MPPVRNPERDTQPIRGQAKGAATIVHCNPHACDSLQQIFWYENQAGR
jgi:hypothetical protein